MPRKVNFIDTSVLCELLKVPGKSQRADETFAELKARRQNGELFVIPISAIIETGNHIEQVKEDQRLRRGVADSFRSLLASLANHEPPYRFHQVTWDESFLSDLCAGDSTQDELVNWIGNGRMGAGDLSILVERDRFVALTAYRREEVAIWTYDNELMAFA